MLRKKRQMVLVSGVVIISLLFLGAYFFSTIKEKEVSDGKSSINSEKSLPETNDLDSLKKSIAGTNIEEGKKNEYYYVYLKQDNEETDTSFIPAKLNPRFKPNTNYNISTSYNNDGTPVEDEKMILIYNYKLSDSNKKNIKEIAGEKNYEEALKEIQDTIDGIKESVNTD